MHISADQMAAIPCTIPLWKAISWMLMLPKSVVKFTSTKTALFGMVGLTSGMIKGNIDSATAGVVNGTVVDANTKRSPSIYFKGGIDKQLNDAVRIRISGSYYHNGSSAGSGLTLYGGDRTGSNYQNVMELWKTPVYNAEKSNASTQNKDSVVQSMMPLHKLPLRQLFQAGSILDLASK